MTKDERLNYRLHRTTKDYLVKYRDGGDIFVYAVKVKESGTPVERSVSLIRRQGYTGDCKLKLLRSREVVIRKAIIDFFMQK